MPKGFCILPLLFLAIAACGVGSEEAVSASPVSVRMQVDADLAVDFFAQPFPLETRRGASHYDLRGFPNPFGSELISFLTEVIEPELQGYGTNAGIYFSFTGPLTFEDAVTDASASLRGEAAVLLVNIDADSPEYLQFTPVFSTFYRGESHFAPPNTLALLPVPGFPLREDTLYAAMVLRDYGMRGQNGVLTQPKALQQALAGTGHWGDTFAPLMEALPSTGMEAGQIAAATVFRTMDITSPVFKARDWLYAAGPTAAVEIHDSEPYGVHRRLRGSFDTVRFQHGEAPFTERGSGAFRLGEDGVPLSAGVDRLRLAMILPAGEPPIEGWPVVVYAHGTGGTYLSGSNTGYYLAEKGIALVSYDQPWHGTRHPGFEDCSGDCPMLYTFNLLNPPAARDGFRQSAMDAVQLLRGVQDLRFRIGGTGAEHHFDSERIYYMGHSQGSTSGPIFVAAEGAGIKAAVFSGPAAGLGLAMLYKTEPVPIPAMMGLVLGDNEGFDLFHPVLSLFQSFVEPADPMNYARYMASEPRHGAVRDILMTAGLLDEFTPAVQAEAFAVATGVQPVAPVFSPLLGMQWRGLPAMEAPFAGNLRTVDGAGWTGGLLQFPENGHFAISCNTTARASYAEFLAAKVQAGDEPAWLTNYGERRNIEGETALCSAERNQ